MSKQLVSGKHRLRNTYWSLVGAASATILSVQPVMAETIWDRFSTIMRDIYGQLVGISTIVAVTVAAIALLVRMVSRNQRAVDEAKVVIVVKDGMVREVFGACPYKFDVEILDMDFNGADPDAENAAQDRLQTVRQYLSKIY